MNWQNLKPVLIILALVVVFSFVANWLLDKMIVAMTKFTYINDNKKVQRYLDWITPMAKVVGKKYGIPYQAIVVQTALETGWGKSSLLSKYNNFGGIKAVAGDNSVSMGTKEFINGQMVSITDKFAVWRTPIEGLEGYANFFHRNKRYKTALNYPNDPYKFIEEIKKAGYATDPGYISKLHGMLNSYFA